MTDGNNPSLPPVEALSEATTQPSAPISTAKLHARVNLKNPELYINRELSILKFHQRVLEQAKDKNIPLLERLRFLCISSNNLDEFFEVRVSGLKQQIAYQSTQAGPDHLSPHEALRRVLDAARHLVNEQYRVLQDVLVPELEKVGITFLRRAEWNRKQADWLRHYFERHVLPVLSPRGLDPAHPFPLVLNKSLNFIVSLEGKDAFGRDSRIAVVQAPRALPRVLTLPEDCASSEYTVVFLSSIIHANVERLFPGMTVTGCYQFRVTRDSELFVDEEATDDLMRALQGELSERRFGDGVRLEVAHNCPNNMVKFLLDQFHLGETDLFRVNGPVNLNRLAALIDLVDRPDLKFTPYTPTLPDRIPRGCNDLFEAIRQNDILIHLPFHSFAPVLDLIRQAAFDPDVLAIKQTLYRAGPDSPIVDSLVHAARAGKEVTVVVELRARFDEEANIRLATRLQEAGAQVVYGVVGFKTHAKMMLIVRREKSELRHYVHLSTGNYHTQTARIYTDYGLLTADPAIGEDVHKLFMQLTGLGRATKLRKLAQAPFTLHKNIIRLISHETLLAQQGKPARIIAKMNSLVEAKVIEALYKASQAGVQIDLIVRGICSLRPGIPGVSENIRVRSIIGRFLEHHRVLYVHNDGNPEIWLSSADWMERNFARRIEISFPIDDFGLKQQIITELNLYLQDNRQAWLLDNHGQYTLAPSANQKHFSSQQALLDRLVNRLEKGKSSKS
jgi:polyphosphate kinase